MSHLRLAAAIATYVRYAKVVEQIPQIDGVEICLDEPDPTYIHVYRHGVTIFTLTLTEGNWVVGVTGDVQLQLHKTDITRENWACIFFERYRKEYLEHNITVVHVPREPTPESEAGEVMVSVRNIASKSYFEMQRGKHRNSPVEEDLFYVVPTVKADAHLSYTRGKHRPAGVDSTKYFVRDNWGFGVLGGDESRSATRDLMIDPTPLTTAARKLQEDTGAVLVDHTVDAALMSVAGTRALQQLGMPPEKRVSMFDHLHLPVRRQRQELVHKGTPLGQRKLRYSKGIQRITLKASNQQQECTLTVYENGQGMAKLAVPSTNSTEVYYFHGRTALQMMNKLLRKPYLSH